MPSSRMMTRSAGHTCTVHTKELTSTKITPLFKHFQHTYSKNGLMPSATMMTQSAGHTCTVHTEELTSTKITPLFKHFQHTHTNSKYLWILPSGGTGDTWLLAFLFFNTTIITTAIMATAHTTPTAMRIIVLDDTLPDPPACAPNKNKTNKD